MKIVTKVHGTASWDNRSTFDFPTPFTYCPMKPMKKGEIRFLDELSVFCFSGAATRFSFSWDSK
jgi:hypothetical protein